MYAVFVRQVKALLLKAPDTEAKRKVPTPPMVSRSRAEEAMLNMVLLANRSPCTRH